MGLAVAKSSQMFYLGNKTDLQFELQKISAERKQLASIMQSASANGGSPPAQLQAQDRQLEQKQKNIETQQKAATTLQETMKELVKKEVDLAFKGLFS